MTDQYSKSIPTDQKITFLVLTKSAKYGKCCIAGLDSNKNFVRLVYDQNGTGIDAKDFVFHDREIKILDVIEVLVEDAPLKIQVENKILKKILTIKGHITKKTLISLIPNIKNGNLLHTSFGRFAEYNSNYKGSLMMIEVTNLKIYFADKQKAKADFQYQGKKYTHLSITDFDYFQKETAESRCILIISIPEKPISINQQSYYYHFIAKIIPLTDF